MGFLWVTKLRLTASGCYNTDFRLFASFNDTLFSHQLKILNCDEIQYSDWKGLIDWYRLVNIQWLAHIDWLDDSTLEDLNGKSSKFEDFMRFRPYSYACTQQFLPPLKCQILFCNFCVTFAFTCICFRGTRHVS